MQGARKSATSSQERHSHSYDSLAELSSVQQCATVCNSVQQRFAKSNKILLFLNASLDKSTVRQRHVMGDTRYLPIDNLGT